MGNLSKEKKELRQELYENKFLKRDYQIYTILEDENNNFRVPYIYSLLCNNRDEIIPMEYLFKFIHDKEHEDLKHSYIQTLLNKSISTKTMPHHLQYLLHIIIKTDWDVIQHIRESDYYISFEPYDKNMFISELEKNTHKRVNTYGTNYLDVDMAQTSLGVNYNNEISKALEKAESRTFIHRAPTKVCLEDKDSSYHSRSAFVEIDFTKSKEEIKDYIERLKNDFDNNRLVLNPHEYLEQETKEPYMCDINKCEIYDHKSPKTLAGTLADTLFIYDARKIGLSEDMIKEEINYYWNNVKNIHKDKIASSTYKKYLNFARLHIEKNKAFDFYTGIIN